MYKWREIAWVGAACTTLLIATSLGRAQQKPDSPALAQESSLKQFLRTFDGDKTTRYISAFPDLNDDGAPEAVVYLMGPEWCGSGGCNLLILEQAGTGWKIITRLTITRPPIRMLRNTSHGWHSIGVWVQGGGIRRGYEAELRFNGKTYPRNPSVSPAIRRKRKPMGEAMISSTQNATPLYEDGH